MSQPDERPSAPVDAVVETHPGRRRSGEEATRWGPLPWLAVVLPLLTALAVALVGQPVTQPPSVPPDTAPLVRTTLVCPPGVGGLVGSVNAELSGAVQIARSEATIAVAGGALSPLPEQMPLVIDADQDLAAGLVAGRAEPNVPCAQPQPEYWFTGLGAGAEHQSTLVLVNPDGGPAVADVTVWSVDGPVDVPDLRGVTVRGGRQQTLELAGIMPTENPLAIRVAISRGRLGVSVVDAFDRVGRAPRLRTAQASQNSPSPQSWLLAGPTIGRHTLTLANPGDTEARATVRLVAEGAEFTPTGSSEVRLPAQSVVEINASRWFADQPETVLGLMVSATKPVTAALHSRLRGQFLAVAPDQRITDGAVLLPPKKQTKRELIVAGASNEGTISIVVRDPVGAEVLNQTIEVRPAAGTAIALPKSAAVLRVVTTQTSVAASVRQSARGGGQSGGPLVAVQPLNELMLHSDIAAVREALH